MVSTSLKLSPQPDGFGFYYGMVSDRSGTVRIDVMPPLAHWHGDMKLPSCEPHATDWVVFADGVEIARVRNREELSAIDFQQLLPSRRN